MAIRAWITLSDLKYHDLGIERIEFPREYRLTLKARYERAIMGYTDVSGETNEVPVSGFYILSPERGIIELGRKGQGTAEIRVNAVAVGVWHSCPSTITLSAKLDPSEFWEIDNRLGGMDVGVYWSARGYGFPEENQIRRLELVEPIPIDCSAPGRLPISRHDFVKNVLEPVDRFKREFFELVLPSSELLDKTPSDLKILADLLRDRISQLENALKKLSGAKTSSDYFNVIGSIRVALSALRDKLESIKDAMASKLYVDFGTLSGEGAGDEARAIVSQLLTILGRLEAMASGLGIHRETTERPPKLYVPNPDRYDARYIILMSILTLSYLTERLRAYIEKRM